MSACIVIVDGYSTGRYLAEAFRRHGRIIAHVPSSAEIPRLLQRSYWPDTFDILVPHAPIADVAAALAHHRVEAVLAGAESGVLYADQLNEALGLTWNVPERSQARRHKHLMHEALQAVGVPTVSQICTDEPEQIASWASLHAHWPIVIKPALSTSSEDVHFCSTPGEIVPVVQAIVGKTNYLDVRNEAVIAQQFMGGPNYIVNSVSGNGRHLTTDVWRCRFDRTTSGNLYIVDQHLLPAHDARIAALISYNNAVLDSVGIRNGPSHTELKLHRGEPRLIETAARLMGATLERDPIVAARGHTQVEWTAKAVCDPRSFSSDLEKPYSLGKHLSIVWVNFDRHGIIEDDAGVEIVEKLESFVMYANRPPVGSAANPACDTTGRGGFIYLSNTSEAALHRDHQAALEAVAGQRLFDVAPTARADRNAAS